MPLTPQITIAGNLADLFGAAQAGSFVVQLCGFGSQIPRVSGTAMIAQTAPLAFSASFGGTPGTYNFNLWGNDVITPSGTFYTIKVVDVNGNTVQINAYQFTGTESIDLSSAAPFNPPPVPTFGTYFADDIVPIGTIDGTNAVFTLPQAPSPPASLNLFLNTGRLAAGIGYTLNGATITYDPSQIPQVGDSHVANYRFAQ